MSRVSSRALAIASMVIAIVLALGSAAGLVPRADADDGVRACQHRGRSARRSRARSSRRRARRPRLTAAQRRQIQRWHQRASRSEVRAWARMDPPPLVFHPLRQRERVALVPASAEGGFDTDDLVLAQQALASREGAMHDIHPRLLELVYRAVRHFEVPYVHVISGYRDGRATSRHAQGRAIDFVLPGVSDRRLAAYLRPQGFVGVGIYPVSGFVHLDVRARSYFWSDGSGPSEPTRERAILAAQTSRYDAAARRRGEESIPDLDVGHDEEEVEEEESATPEIADEAAQPPPDAGVSAG
ncbi:YcbK family protein [Sandaracinus amylolyticus]|uniref:Peptidase M15A C-terminal domain-containing protein n=1 Tax=Sandaracinus amylolyticus TaxID=927083 RepID=A0A0F6VZI7_9BACT|nr:DUF882 domain-containing protein [Sandaracinus amylolyticus]AKF03618.1 hypothetical protein DB32_000767 [Sandaracinus amylolyticus]